MLFFIFFYFFFSSSQNFAESFAVLFPLPFSLFLPFTPSVLPQFCSLVKERPVCSSTFLPFLLSSLFTIFIPSRLPCFPFPIPSRPFVPMRRRGQGGLVVTVFGSRHKGCEFDAGSRRPLLVGWQRSLVAPARTRKYLSGEPKEPYSHSKN